MKKAILICIIPFLIILFVGIFEYAIFLIARSEIRSELKQKIKQGIKDELLFKYTINSKNYLKNGTNTQWLENGKEVKIQDRLFDVIRKVKDGNNLILYLLNDANELNLINMLDHYLESKPGGPVQKILKEIYQLKYLPSELFDSVITENNNINFLTIEVNQTLNGFLKGVFQPPIV